MKHTGVSVAAPQSQWFSGAAQTYCRFSTPTSFRKFPFLCRGRFSEVSRIAACGTYSRKGFQATVLSDANFDPDPKTGNCRKPHQGSRQPRPQNRQLPKTAPGVAPSPTPKPAIAKNRTRGRAKPDPKTGNCRKQYQGSRQPRPQNRQLPKTAPGVAPTPTPKPAIAENSTRGRATPGELPESGVSSHTPAAGQALSLKYGRRIARQLVLPATKKRSFPIKTNPLALCLLP